MPEASCTEGLAVPVTPTARKAWPGWWPAGLAWALWALAMLGLTSIAWLDRLLRQAGPT